MTDRRELSSKPLCALAFGVWGALISSQAEAHLVTTGLGPVYDGISHFALALEDLIPVLALALLAGLRGKEHGRRVLVVLPAAWLLGGLVGLAAAAPVIASVSWIPFVLIGGLVAADIRLSVTLTTALAVLLGLFHGYLNGATMEQTGPGALGLAGVAANVFVVVTLVAAFVVTLRADWTRIAVRVAGSWVAAIGILLFGWSFR
jgi:hydrogenase/urease accessory protein HupE